MSYVSIYGIPLKSPVRLLGEVHNSHRGAAVIWDIIGETYCGVDGFPWGRENRDLAREIWGKWKDPEVPFEHRFVLASTMDRVMIRRDHVAELIRCMEVFDHDFPGRTNLAGQIEILRPVLNGRLVAVGWNQTSIGGSPWQVPGRRGFRKFNLSRDILVNPLYDSSGPAVWVPIYDGQVFMIDGKYMLTGLQEIPPL